ncbi:MAG: tetratricopeptide repeat protein [Cyclobacteriaceae bacterium]
MPSLLPDYEYDIFISYRHKDNRAEKWVSQFVQALREELEGTFKESISIYFDENPYDGLLENHSVDQSLNSKLKSLILIPIVSQTYTDPKSYAWQHEFCEFNKIALKDTIGRDIRLGNSNVASRILPITIHELNTEDIDQIETELQAKFRSIDFTYRAPGVNRALRQDDRREDNIGRLAFRDQMNKVANALKEIINGIRFPDKPGYGGIPTGDEDSAYLKSDSPQEKPKETNDKSIAVLPFVSLAQDSSQEYFADGMTENILMQLAGIRELKVISRTSVMRYKKTNKLVPEIAAELGVKYILEGSAQSHNNKVRINVQLIDAKKDDPIWSKVFVESMDDIFGIQDKVAEVVAQQLKSSISPGEKSNQKPTQNLEAYDLFLKGRYAFNQWNVEGYQIASDYFKKALALDPEFKLAYSYLASSYSARMSWNGDLSPSEALPLISQYLDEAWKRGATDNDYLTNAFIEFFINKDFTKTETLLSKALELSPNNANLLYTYSYLLCMTGRLNEAEKMIDQAKLIEPLSVAYFNYQGIYLYLSQKYTEAVSLFKEGMKLFPKVVRFSDHLGRICLTMGLYDEAKEVLLSGLHDSNTRHPSMVAYLAMAEWHLDEKDKSKKLLEELYLRRDNNEKGINYYLAHIYCSIGDDQKTTEAIVKARQTNDIDLIWFDVDPLLKSFRQRGNHAVNTSVDFESAEKFIVDKLKAEMPANLSYHNIDHINDVVESAIRIAQSENLTDEDIRLLRIAALYHDAGFISTYKGHEAQGCQLVKDTLPTFGFSTQQLDTICSMIMTTKIPQSPKTQLDKILCDADLDYLGRDDFYEIGNRLYNEMKDQGLIETEREWNLTQKVFLENHRYHTDFGKNQREDKKQKHLTEVIAKLKR